MAKARKLIESIDAAIAEGNAATNCVTYVRELAEIVASLEVRATVKVAAAPAPSKPRKAKRG